MVCVCVCVYIYVRTKNSHKSVHYDTFLGTKEVIFFVHFLPIYLMCPCACIFGTDVNLMAVESAIFSTVHLSMTHLLIFWWFRCDHLHIGKPPNSGRQATNLVIAASELNSPGSKIELNVCNFSSTNRRTKCTSRLIPCLIRY